MRYWCSLFLLLGLAGVSFAQSGGWHRVDLGAREYNGIYFLNDHEGWLTTGFAGGISKVLHTTDAGVHWSQVGPNRLWDTTGVLGDSSYTTIYFYDSLHGIVRAGYDDDRLRDVILRTADGGSSWTATTPGIARVNDFLMIAKGRLAAIGRSKISLSADSGDSWLDLPMGDGISFFNTIASADGVHLMVGGDEGTYRDTLPPYNLYSKALMFQSSNNGIRWMETPTQFAHGVQQIVAFDSTTFLVFSISTMFRTTDFGANWSRIETGADQAIFSASFSSPRTGTAVGRYGTIIRTTDGGETWAKQVSGVGSDLFKVVMLNDSFGFVSGGSGTLLTTSTGGKASAEINAEVNPRVQIYPQPSHDFAVIRLSAHYANLTFKLFGMDGRQTLAVNPNLTSDSAYQEFSIQTSKLPSGLYTYTLSTDKSTFSGLLLIYH